MMIRTMPRSAPRPLSVTLSPRSVAAENMKLGALKRDRSGAEGNTARNAFHPKSATGGLSKTGTLADFVTGVAITRCIGLWNADRSSLAGRTPLVVSD